MTNNTTAPQVLTPYVPPAHLQPLRKPGSPNTPLVIVVQAPIQPEPSRQSTDPYGDVIFGAAIVLTILILFLACVGPLLAWNLWIFKGAL